MPEGEGQAGRIAEMKKGGCQKTARSFFHRKYLIPMTGFLYG